MAGYAMQSAAAKGFNPFLAETDLSSSGAEFPYQEAAVSNPFLSSFTQDYSAPPEPQLQPEPRASDNPFLNYSSAPAPAPAPSGGGGNPFADFFQNSAHEIPNDTPSAWPPVNDEHISQNNIVDYVSEPYYEPDVLPTRRPSVPRSTQDLLDTVTGALQATSDTLLDRLRVTQPSPVPQPPSPTPSPRTPSPDLWGEHDDHMPIPAPPPSANSITKSQNDPGHSIMDLFDAPPGGPKSSFEILGLYGAPAPAAAAPATVNDLFSMDEPTPVPAPTQTVEAKIIVPTPATPTPVSETQEEILAPVPEPIVEHREEIEIDIRQTETFPEPPVPEPETVQPPSSAFDSILFQEKAAPPPPEPEPMGVPMRPAPPPMAPEPAAYVPPPAAQEMAFPMRPEYTPFPVQTAPVPAPFMAAVEPVRAAAPPERPKPPPVPAPPTRTPGRPPPPVPPAPRVCHPPPPRPSPVQQMQQAEVIAVEIPVAAPAPVARPSPFASAPAPAPEIKPAFVPVITDTKVFDAFDSKFDELAAEKPSGADPFGDTSITVTSVVDSSSAWGDSGATTITGWGDSDTLDTKDAGFGNDAGFDSFLAMTEPPPVPQSTPCKIKGDKGYDSDKDESDLSIFIRPKTDDGGFHLAPALAPPPKSPAISTGSNLSEDSTSFVPFLSSVRVGKDVPQDLALGGGQVNRSDSQDSPQTPLFEEDQSQPLEDFPRTKYTGTGWDMHMRHPNKKKITGQRFWKKVFVQIAVQNDIPIVQIYNAKTDKDPIQEIPLQPCYSVSDISAQQFDQFGKIFTVKLQYVFYKERPGVRPGQISKAGRITDKLSQFAAYAIQGDYQGVKEFGSDLRKLGMPIEHAPQISQLAKLGTQTYEEIKQFSMCIEEALFRLPVHRDRAITYKTEEVQVTLVDEYYVEQDTLGIVTRQIARVRLFFLSFLSGSTEVELGVNDMRRQGKEVVGRHDIIPIATEEWIRTEEVELSNCVQLDEFDRTKLVKFKPPDACYIELMRFRVRPPRHRELPLQVKTVFTTTGNRIEMRSDILVPGFTSRKLGQIPCEDVMVLIPIPECWIYMFRVEKHFRYGSVKSAHRRSGKVKGIERFLGAVETVEQSLMEVTSGQAKYEHQHKGIVWRVARLPKEGQGAYTTHSFFCHITLQSHEQVPDNLTKYCYVEFTMPHTTISHTVCRSVAVPSCDEPPEKCVKYLSRHEYIVEIEHSTGITPGTYNLAASVAPKVEEKIEEEIPMPGKAESDSDFSDE